MPYATSFASSEARTNLFRLVDEVCQGAEKIITRNGEPAAALIDAKRLGYYHQLERDRDHLMLMDEAEKGLTERRARSKAKKPVWTK